MEFAFLVPENARLRARISQRSNLKYVARVLERFDDRQKQDFRDSCFGFLANAPDIQFSAQLIQQLVFRTVRTDKKHELWFNLQGHLCRFGLQEYALVTGLRCCEHVHDDHYLRVITKKRLKEKYFKGLDRISCAQLEKTFLKPSTPRSDRYKLGLAIIVEGVFNAPDNNVGVDEIILSIVDDLDIFFAYPWGRVGYTRLLKGWRGEWAKKFCDGKRKNEKEITYTIHGFPIAIQVWAFEAVPEIGARFGQRIANRSPRLLNWTASKQPQHRTYDNFFKKIKLHVYATLRPTDDESVQPYISSLRLLEDNTVPALDNIASSVVGPQFDEAADLDERNNDGKTSDVEEAQSTSGSAKENSSADDQEGPTDYDNHEDGSDHSDEESQSEEPRVEGQCAFSAAYNPRSNVSPHRGPSTSTPRGAQSEATISKYDVEGMLLDQRILLEMRMRTHALEIMNHVSTEFGKFRNFISNLVAPPVSTPANAHINDPVQPADAPVQPMHTVSVAQACAVDDQRRQVNRSQAVDDDAAFNEKNVLSGQRSERSSTASESGSHNSEMRETKNANADLDSEHTDIQECLPTVDAIAEEGGDMEPDSEPRDIEDCLPTIDAMEDKGNARGTHDDRNVVDVRENIAIPTTRRRSARLRKPAASTRTPYTRGRKRYPKNR